MKIIEFGEGERKIAIVGSLHGNETVGKQVISMLSKENGRYKDLRIKAIVANEEAIKKNKRFVDIDGNRCFPGSRRGNNEERIAYRILKELKGYDYVLDIHSTYANMPDTIIITKRAAMKLANKVPLKKLVRMSQAIHRGGALISYPKYAVSLEFYRKRSPKQVLSVVKRILDNFTKNKNSATKKESYLVNGVLRGKAGAHNMKNYRLVRAGTKMAIDGKVNVFKSDFYPIFIGERGYKNTICMTAIRQGISLD